jgi:CheY-like chemotaxis protein
VHVLRAANAHRALSLLDDRPINVVVLDYSLPDRDGLDVLKDIRSRRADLPVVFLTSADSAEICAKALKGGAVDYVVKKRNYLEVLPRSSQACPPVADVRPTPVLDARSADWRESGVEQLRCHPFGGSLARPFSRGRDRTGRSCRAVSIRLAGARGPFVP